MRHRHCTPKTTTTWEKMGKSQHKCSPTFQSWESELSTQEIAAFKIENNKRILARGISPHIQNLLQGCIWWLVDAPTRLFNVYGFSMMLSGESPSMLFDLVLTRFEADYNPHLIYDASCLAKEYGYNRELRRFMSLTITTDRFHECNHTSCSAAFKSSEYSSLENINSEACEQKNSGEKKSQNFSLNLSPIFVHHKICH